MQEFVYREKSSGTDIIEYLQLKWVEIMKAVTGRYSIKSRNGVFDVLLGFVFMRAVTG